MTQIEGIASISEHSFTFDSGLPTDEFVTEVQILKGVMHIHANASADFEGTSPRDVLPPEMTSVAKTEDYIIRRSTRNYIIQLKVPIVQSRRVTEKYLEGLVPEVMGEITMDRAELFEDLVA